MAVLDDIINELQAAGAGGVSLPGASPFRPADPFTNPAAFSETAAGLMPAPAPRRLVSSPLQDQPQTSARGSQLFGGNPDNLKKLVNKWAEMRDIRDQIDPATLQALINYDAERVSIGSQPLTREETLRAALAVDQNRQITQQPERDPRSLWSNFVSDLDQAVSAIPRIPQAIFNELREIPQMGVHVQEALASGANPIEAYATAPGIRLLPGAFIAENLDNPAELARHPLFTVLDILPGAKAAAGTTRVAREAAQQAGRVVDLERAGASAAEIQMARLGTTNPMKAVLTRRLDDDGNLTRNALGSAIEYGALETKIGRSLSSAFGQASRDSMRLLEGAGFRLAAVRDGLVDPQTVMEQALRDTTKLAEKYSIDITDKVQADRLYRAATRYDQAGLTPNELAYLGEVRQLTERLGKYQVSLNEMVELDISGRTEFYPLEQGRKILTARQQASHAERMGEWRAEALAPSGARTLDDFRAAFDRIRTLDPDLTTRSWFRAEARTVLAAMDAYGYDTVDLAKFTGRNSTDIPGLLQKFDELVATGSLTPKPRLSFSQLTDLMNRSGDPQIEVLRTALADGNTKRVTKALDNLLNRRTWPDWLKDQTVIDSIRSLRDRLRLENSTMRKFTDKEIRRRRTAAEKVTSRTAPARFQPLIADETMRRVNDSISSQVPPEVAGRVATHLSEINWSAAARELDDAGVASLSTHQALTDYIVTVGREVEATWRDMAARGLDPVFVHKVQRGKVQSSVVEPRIGPVPTNITQTRERNVLAELGPSVNNVQIALSHQSMEMLQRTATENALDTLVRRYGISQADLQDQLTPDVRIRNNGEFDAQVLQDMMGSRYRKFDPAEAGYAWGGEKLRALAADQVWIPIALHDNLKKIANPKGAIHATLDTATNTFRMSVVGLSPRTQLYNILGGALMVMGRTSPAAFKDLQRAWKMVRNPRLIDNESVRATISGFERSMRGDEFTRATATSGVLFGRTMARILDEHLVGRGVKAGANQVQRLIDWSLTKNAMFDDMYRVTAYLYGHDKALRKGMTKEAAEAAGEELMRKTMMDWTGMTPIERNVFKSIFPFYGFMSHALRYVAKYPVDHPLRASVIAAFGRAEEEDLGALPMRYLGMLALGIPGSDGKQTWVNTAAVNPFVDVANMFTITGFLSSTNPVLTTALEQAGIVRGEAELYPTLRYDPESGRMAARNPNFLLSFVENTIPQTSVITGLLGLNREFTSMQQRDPYAARRFLASAAGIPITHREFSMPAEIAKAERARQQSEAAAKTAALESGNWDEALRYPGLRDFFASVEQLPPELLAQFTPASREVVREQLSVLVGTQPTQGGFHQQGGW